MTWGEGLWWVRDSQKHPIKSHATTEKIEAATHAHAYMRTYIYVYVKCKMSTKPQRQSSVVALEPGRNNTNGRKSQDVFDLYIHTPYTYIHVHT